MGSEDVQDVDGLQNPFCDRLRWDVKRLHEKRYVKPGGSQEQFYDIVSRFGIIYFFSFFPV